MASFDLVLEVITASLLLHSAGSKRVTRLYPMNLQSCSKTAINAKMSDAVVLTHLIFIKKKTTTDNITPQGR